MTPHYYNVSIHWNKDRRGMMCSPELSSGLSNQGCIEVATPPEFPKGIPGIWSPEHLFTAAISSCLMTTFLAVAESSKLDFVSFDCSAKGKLDQLNGKWLMTEVALEPIIGLTDQKDSDRALRILQKAEAACLISNSVNSKVIMNPTINIVTKSLVDQ